MFSRKPNPRVLELDAEISRVLAVLARCEPDDEEYTDAIDNWTKLCEERSKLLPSRISKDQVLLVGGNVLIASLVLAFEKSHVISTKLHSFIGKASR